MIPCSLPSMYGQGGRSAETERGPDPQSWNLVVMTDLRMNQNVVTLAEAIGALTSSFPRVSVFVPKNSLRGT